MSDTSKIPPIPSAGPLRHSRPRSKDAVFMGWQMTRSGEPVALYNVTVKGHPYNGSTVSSNTLRRLHLTVPSTPPVDTIGYSRTGNAQQASRDE